MSANRVRITEVAPRDGLQAERAIIDTPTKAKLVALVQDTGVDEVEVSSFVSPKWVPQLADAAHLFATLAPAKPDHVLYSALVPNEQGLDAALTVNRSARRDHGVERLIDKVSVFTSASEGFALKNTNATIEETLKRFAPLIPRAKEHGLRTRAYISCVVRCPFDGDISPIQVADVASRLLELGVDEIDLGDTIGAATPDTIEQVILEVIDRLDGRATNDAGDPTLTLHLHDTFGNAGACVERALELGVRSFDASAGGLGGCPYASKDGERAPGNIATSTLVSAIERAGCAHSIDTEQLDRASKFAQGLIG